MFHRSSTEVPEAPQKSKIVVNHNKPFSQKSANETFSQKSKIVFHSDEYFSEKSNKIGGDFLEIKFNNKKNFSQKKLNQPKVNNQRNFFKKLDGTVNHGDFLEIKWSTTRGTDSQEKLNQTKVNQELTSLRSWTGQCHGDVPEDCGQGR